MGNRWTTVILLVFLLLFAGIIFLQIFLSKRESRWPGLVLPVIAFLWSFLYPFNMAVPLEGVPAGLIARAVLVWLLGNIPTLVLLTIYLCCREKQRCSKQLEKMNIQDLD